MRGIIHYLCAVVLLALYGGEVCPFLEELGTWKLGALLLAFFAAGFMVRTFLERRFVRSASLGEQAGRQLTLDLGTFVVVGLTVTVFDFLVYRFPFGSGMKLLLGCVILGLFSALDLALARERQVMQEAVRRGQPLTPRGRFIPLTRRFAAFSVVTITLVCGVILLLIAKDLAWLEQLGPERLPEARAAVLIEVVFVSAVVFVHLLNVVLSYTRNLKGFFDKQMSALEKVADGHLDQYVLTPREDEFGLIAHYTNRMIDGLKERDRIRGVFGKLVSPAVARELLENPAGGVQLGGSRHKVVVLFSDVRNYTTRTERARPEDVVRDLNRYFTRMVEIVHAEGGIVDKFIGDGMMAVFGLRNPAGAAQQAVRAGLRMLEAIPTLGLEGPFEIGIGIHSGEAVAGNIGSPDRLEFTFIGDAVNTASRLEGLCKSLCTPIVLSETLVSELDGEPAQAGWRCYGEQPLKGKAKPMRVFGLCPAEGSPEHL